MNRAACALVVGLLVTGSVGLTPSSGAEAAGWYDTQGCARWIAMWLDGVNPNISKSFQSIEPGPPPCASLRTQVTADLFGTSVHAFSMCQSGFTGMTQFTPGAYGNPWWTTAWIPGSVDCGQPIPYFP